MPRREHDLTLPTQIGAPCNTSGRAHAIVSASLRGVRWQTRCCLQVRAQSPVLAHTLTGTFTFSSICSRRPVARPVRVVVVGDGAETGRLLHGGGAADRLRLFRGRSHDVHLNAHSYDRTGRYSRALALRAGQDFHRGLRRYWVKIAIGVLALLLAALALDALTAGTGMPAPPQYPPLDPVRGDHGVGEVRRSGRHRVGALVAAAAASLRPGARAGGQALRLRDRSR